jgi:hypothetical protein
MSKVDWSLAPEGATHYTYGSPDPWRDYSTNTAMYWSTIRKEWSKMCLSSSADCLNSDVPHEARSQPKPWSGPEDGLPPVGSTVQVWDKEPHKFYAKHVGKNVSILAHRVGSYGEEVAVYCVKADDGTDEYHALVEACFRTVQHREDARETSIRELMDIAQVDCRVTAARLVDAGFKREVA